MCLTREREAIYFAARCLNIVTTGLERGVSMPSDVTLRLPRVLYPAGSLKKAWFPVRNDANCSTKKKLNHSIQRRQRPWGGGGCYHYTILENTLEQIQLIVDCFHFCLIIFSLILNFGYFAPVFFCSFPVLLCYVQYNTTSQMWFCLVHFAHQ